MKLDLKAVSYKKCKQYHMDVNPVFETQLCAIGESGKGACHVSIGLRYWIVLLLYIQRELTTRGALDVKRSLPPMDNGHLQHQINYKCVAGF